MPFAKFILHAESRGLDYPQNRCLEFKYNSKTDTLGGEIEVSDAKAIEMIKDGRIKHVSVEHRNYSDGGMSFDKLSLLTNDLQPRDPQARIISFVTVMEEDNNNLTYGDIVAAVKAHYPFARDGAIEKLAPQTLGNLYRHTLYCTASFKAEDEATRFNLKVMARAYEKLAEADYKKPHDVKAEWSKPMPATFERVID